MFDFAALDVALGLIFVYLVLALLCTAINETMSSILAWRADTLRDGIKNLLGSDEARLALYQHPLVAGLIRQKGSRLSRMKTVKKLPLVRKLPAVNDERFPSYLPARVVVTALLYPADGSQVLTKEQVEKAIAALPDGPVQKAAEVLWSDARHNVGRFIQSMETWYDEAMSRVSGWYRRRVQVWLWVWAIGVTLAFHADSIQIARTLWLDDATRAVVVARAEQASQAPLTEDSVQDAVESVQDLDRLQIPIGWPDSWPAGNWVHDLEVIFVNLLGLGMTAVALTLGAPFWFDLLKKVANIRAAGKAPEERPVEKPAEAGEPSAPDRGSVAPEMPATAEAEPEVSATAEAEPDPAPKRKS